MDLACFDLVNSLVHDYRGTGTTHDHLTEADWLAQFQARWGLSAAGPADAAARARLADLRTDLRRLIDQLAAGTDLDPAALGAVDRTLAAAALRRQLRPADGGWRLELRPIQHDWTWALAEIAASFASLLTEHDPARVRVCENPDCRWAFYDTSRSRTRRWCGDSCGNLVKVRRFRARQRHPERHWHAES